MKRFGKRMNRGLLLAALIVVGLVIYTKVDEIQFTSAKPVIEQLVSEYLEEVKHANMSPTGEKLEHADLLLDRYWKSMDNGYFRYERTTKQDQRQFIERLKEETGGVYTELESYDYAVRGLQVVKNGPGCAKATLDYSVMAKTKEFVDDYQILGLETDWYGVTGGSENETIGRSYKLNILFYENDGMWKIGSIDSSRYETEAQSAE